MSVQILGTRYLDHIQCPICLELFDDPIITKCSHTFCNKCVKLLQVCPFDQTSLVHSQHTKNRSLRDLIEFLEENITVDEANNIIKRGTYIDSFKVMGYTITLNWKLFFLVGALIEIIVRVPLIVCLKALALVLTFSLSLKMSKLLFKGVIRAVLTLATVLNRISSPLEKSMSLGGYVFGFFSLPFALSYPRFERFFFESWQTMALCFFVFFGSHCNGSRFVSASRKVSEVVH